MNAFTKPSVHLMIVQPAGYVHSMGLLDAALYFRHQFRELGVDVTIAKNRPRIDAPNLIFGAHLGLDPGLMNTFCCILVNLEQLGPGGSRMPAPYLNLLRTSPVIDYDVGNLEAYGRSEGDTPRISFGFAPYLASPATSLPLDQRPLDLLFFGSMNERRKNLLQRIERTGRTVVSFDTPVYGPERDAFVARSRAVLNCHHYDSAVFEQVRAFHVLSLGTPMVSERTARTRPASAYEDAVSWFTDETLESFFSNEYAQREFAQRAERQLREFRDFNPRDQYAAALDYVLATFGAAPSHRQAPVCAQRLLHIGSGTDYRAGWLNLGDREAAQSDICVDLGRRHSWPITCGSPFWGSVQLQAGASELIFVTNILEHMKDLRCFMRNCLDLLRVDGRMVVQVPCNAGLELGQQTGQVQAARVASWRNYTDRFWSLGWHEYRFKIQECRWLNDKNQPCEESTAALMLLTFGKCPITVAESMAARTMLPDFGALIDPVLLVPARQRPNTHGEREDRQIPIASAV